MNEEFTSFFSHYSKYRGNFQKAIETVLLGSVKRHVFRPSGRIIYSVVGRGGDEFIDPMSNYCSCSDYFFRVLGGKQEYCYHLLSYKIALEGKRFDEIKFDDEEYEHFFKLMIRDILSNLEDKGDKAS